MTTSQKTNTFEEGYYKKNYHDYVRQNPDKKLEFYEQLIKKRASNMLKPRILELGCAFGQFLGTLTPDWKLFGSDISQFAVGQAQRALPNISFCVSNGNEMPFKDNSFDIIVAFDVIEHLKNLDNLAFNISRKISSQGYFIFVVPVYDGPTGPIIHYCDKDPTHIHKKSRNYWLSWTQKHFHLAEWQGIFRYLLPWGYYMHYHTKIFKHCCPAIVVVASNKK